MALCFVVFSFYYIFCTFFIFKCNVPFMPPFSKSPPFYFCFLPNPTINLNAACNHVTYYKINKS